MDRVLLHHEEIPTSISGAIAYRIRHRSVDVHGTATESTGLVVAPRASGSNRRVISWTHGTTGTGDAACPSAQPDPARELTLYYETGSTTQIDYGIPGLQQLIDDDCVVVATDYQGLGTPGVHQYTVNRTQANDGVMIVHAARELPVGAGTRFGVFGWSQGGGTAAATLELDAEIYGDLTHVGAVCQSPGIPSLAVASPDMGSALTSNDIKPDGHLFMTLGATAMTYPDSLSLDDVFTEVGTRVWNDGWNTQPGHHFADVLTRTYLHEGQVMAIDTSKMPAWIAAFGKGAAAQRTPVAPVLVQIDTQFGDGPANPMVQPVPPAWQRAYVDAIRTLGADVTVTDYPNDDHFSLPRSAFPEAREWLFSKF